jgi:hypothetical protein
VPDADAAVILAGIRERAAAAADLPLAEFARLIDRDARTVAGWIAASALDVPPLIRAVEAALAHHVEAVIEDARPRFRYCKTCSGHPKWPCPEVRDITAALKEGAGA